GRPRTAVLVGAGRAGIAVARIAIRAFEFQVFDERHAFDERYFDFAEAFLDVERTAGRRRRAGKTGGVARRERVVRTDEALLLAVFGTDRDRDRILGPRALNAPRTEITGQRTLDIGFDHLGEQRVVHTVEGDRCRRRLARRCRIEVVD